MLSMFYKHGSRGFLLCPALDVSSNCSRTGPRAEAALIER